MQALIQLLGQQQQGNIMGAMGGTLRTGMQSLGQGMEQQAQQQMGMVQGAPAARLKLAMEKLAQQKAQREDTASTNPANLQFLMEAYKRRGITVPQGASAGMLQANLPGVEKTEQFKALPPGSTLFNPANGKGPPGVPQGPNQADQIADSIIEGKQPPDLKGMYRFGPQIKAALAKKGFDLSSAQQEWAATQKHLSTMNGQQQERLRQAVDFTSHSLDVIAGLYEDWKHMGAASGLKAFNKMSLAASKQLPGEAGAAAQALEGQINDLTAELGNVYMGGNSPTDHALKLASQNLSADWNDMTFQKALGLIRTNLKMRQNAMMHSSTAGGSRYDKPPPGAPAVAAPTDAAALRKKYGL